MSRDRRLQFENLERRELLSASRAGVKLKSDHAALLKPAVVRSVEPAAAVKTLAAGAAANSQSSRWDKIILGTWYVPPVNRLAYLVGPLGIKPLAVSDQTIFHFTRANRGAFAGTGSVTLARPGEPSSTTDFTIKGVVTPEGRLRINFTPTNPNDAAVTGLGQMELINRSWRMTMQVASKGDVKLFHWANMTKLPAGGTIPTKVVDPGNTAAQWRWLLNTRWGIEDTSGISGQFRIHTFRKGYFFGRGSGSSKFSVVASVTPEGKLLMLLISPDGFVNRYGTIERKGKSATMRFRSYEGTAGMGVAVWINPAIRVPHIQLLAQAGARRSAR